MRTMLESLRLAPRCWSHEAYARTYDAGVIEAYAPAYAPTYK